MSHTTAKIIADTIHPVVKSARITTLEVYAPRFLLAEINTHRVLAKSAASSRAIPIARRLDMVQNTPFIPASFGKNKAGMQATETLEDREHEEALRAWKGAISTALDWAKTLNACGVHKQLANRVLEPFAYYHGVITATEWTNFFSLRLHPDAQPEFQELAQMMANAMLASTPKKSKYHLPYVDGDDELSFEWRAGNMTDKDLFDVSAARCARVSYQTHDGKPFSLSADKRRVCDLIAGGHMSPFDHAAVADDVSTGKVPLGHGEWNEQSWWQTPGDHRQFWGWIPDRVQIEKITGMPPGRRDSYARIMDFN